MPHQLQVKEHRPRLSVQIRADQHERLNQLVPFGVLRPLMEAVLDDLLHALSTHGPAVLGAIMHRQVKMYDVAPCLKENAQ